MRPARGRAASVLNQVAAHGAVSCRVVHYQTQAALIRRGLVERRLLSAGYQGVLSQWCLVLTDRGKEWASERGGYVAHGRVDRTDG